MVDIELIADVFGIDDIREIREYGPRYNIAPIQQVPAVRLGTGNTVKRELHLFRWGLIPAWAKDISIGARMINARAETVDQKPAFKNSFRKRRCIVPADGFYEWRKEGPGKGPYYFQLGDGELFGIAGLWEAWKNREGEIIESCALITTEANELVGEIHDRMPVIIGKKDYDTWLYPDVAEPGELKSLLRPFPADKMTFHSVGKDVNNPRNDNVSCIAPL